MARRSNAQKVTVEQVSTKEEAVTQLQEGHKVETTTEVAEAAKTEELKIESVDLTEFGSNKSAKIRALTAHGFARADIARHLGVKYQYVRNVLLQAPTLKA